MGTERIAETLTKQWLMGIRRGWLTLMQPSISILRSHRPGDQKLGKKSSKTSPAKPPEHKVPLLPVYGYPMPYINDALDELAETEVGDTITVQRQHRNIKEEVERLRKEVERLRNLVGEPDVD